MMWCTKKIKELESEVEMLKVRDQLSSLHAQYKGYFTSLKIQTKHFVWDGKRPYEILVNDESISEFGLSLSGVGIALHSMAFILDIEKGINEANNESN